MLAALANCCSSYTLGVSPPGPLHVLPLPGKLFFPVSVGLVLSPSHVCQLVLSFTSRLTLPSLTYTPDLSLVYPFPLEPLVASSIQTID